MGSDEIMVICIVALVMAAGLVRTWIKAKHGLPLDDGRSERRQIRMDKWRQRHGFVAPGGDLDAERQVRLLSDENEKLVGKIGRLEERLAVLERIATDPAERTSREIDALRDR